MNTRFEFSDLLNEYVKRENRRPGQLNDLTGIPKSSIENWLSGYSRRPRNWQDVVKLAKALHLSPSETDQLLRAAEHPTIKALWDAADTEDMKLLEHLSFTTGRHEPNSVFHDDQVTGNNFGRDQVAGHKFEGNNVSGNWVMGDNFSGPKIVANNTGDVVMNDQYKANTINFGSYPSSSQQSRRQASSERSPNSDFRQPSTQEARRQAHQRSPSVGTELMLLPPVATPEVFQVVKALEAELSKGRGADAMKVGQLLTQLDRDRTVNEQTYVQLLRKIADSPNVLSSVRSTVLNRLKRIH